MHGWWMTTVPYIKIGPHVDGKQNFMLYVILF